MAGTQLLALFALASCVLVSGAYALHDMQCGEVHNLIASPNGRLACVFDDTLQVLQGRGWTVPADEPWDPAQDKLGIVLPDHMAAKDVDSNTRLVLRNPYGINATWPDFVQDDAHREIHIKESHAPADPPHTWGYDPAENRIRYEFSHIVIDTLPVNSTEYLKLQHDVCNEWVTDIECAVISEYDKSVTIDGRDVMITKFVAKERSWSYEWQYIAITIDLLELHETWLIRGNYKTQNMYNNDILVDDPAFSGIVNSVTLYDYKYDWNIEG